MEEFYTVRQVQDILKVDRITIYRMLNDGRLKGIKIGQQWRFPQSEIKRMVSGDLLSAPINTSPTNNLTEAGFPTHCIQTIQNLYSEISRISALVLDMEGNPLTSFSQPCRYCTLLLSSATGREACRVCWKESAELSVRQTHFTCHAGLQYLAVPIYDRGRQIGALLTGQFYWQSPDRYEESERVQKLAATHHIDPDELQSAVLDVQIIPNERHAQVESWPRHAVDAMHSILNERSGFMQRLQQIADLTQVS
jgi:excisionase family DNA binding protein